MEAVPRHGSVFRMSKKYRDNWEKAARFLCDFAMVAPRTGEDWRADAQAVMNLRTSDPRGWLEVNDAPETDAWCDRTHPFIPPFLSEFDTSVFPVPKNAAIQLMSLLHADWFAPWAEPDFDERKDDLMERAEVVLDRFGENAVFYTNATAARDDPEADMFHREQIHECFTDYPLDCGVIAVSSDEVGVFWGFFIGD